jgi:precorrin-6B methylase 2
MEGTAVSVAERKPRQQEPAADGGRTCALPTWALIGGITAGVGVALALSAGAGPALALGPEGPLVEEFWDNMRRYALYALTVSTGVAYTVLQPIVELLKNPVTALLIVAVIAGSGFLVSQVLNAMVGNSDFIYRYE